MEKWVPPLFVNKLCYVRYNTNGFKNKSDTIKTDTMIDCVDAVLAWVPCTVQYTRQRQHCGKQFQWQTINNCNATTLSSIKRFWNGKTIKHGPNEMIIFDIWLQNRSRQYGAKTRIQQQLNYL